jgi:hypothetical protein
MSKDLSFLEFKDDDSPSLRDMKSYWQMVMDMPEPERKVFLQAERVKQEEHYLQWMIESNKVDDSWVSMALHRSKQAVADYELYKDEAVLETAELWVQIAQDTKEHKFTLTDIRKQRELIWQEKRKLKTMQQNAEQSPSSSHSKT